MQNIGETFYNAQLIIESFDIIFLNLILPVLRFIIRFLSMTLKYGLARPYYGLDGKPMFENTRLKTISVNGKIHEELYIIEPLDLTSIKGIIYYLHGGGFVLVDAYLTIHSVEWWARYGYIVVVIEYPLAPETKFPISEIQCIYNINYINNIYNKENNFTTSVIGDSSGSNMALHLTLCINNKNLLKTLLNLDENTKNFITSSYFQKCDYISIPEFFKIDHLILHSALIYNYKNPDSITKFLINRLWSLYDGSNNVDISSFGVDLFSDKIINIPRILICTGSEDFLKNHSLKLYNKLSNRGYEIQLKIYPNVTHSFNCYSSGLVLNSNLYDQSLYNSADQYNFINGKNKINFSKKYDINHYTEKILYLISMLSNIILTSIYQLSKIISIILDPL